MHIATTTTQSLVKTLTGPASSSRRNFLNETQAWLRLNLDKWDWPTRERWKLDNLASLRLEELPVEESSLNPLEELNSLISVPPLSMEILAMRIRDIFWSGVTLCSATSCPRCEAALLKILETDQGEVVLSCDICAWTQTEAGTRLGISTALRPATTINTRGTHSWQASRSPPMSKHKVICPSCEGDWLVQVSLVKLHRSAILCPECDALWTNPANVSVANQEDYATFMRRHGRATPESKDEIEILGPLEL